ncbi:MAG: DUF87 domain-containing protein [Nanoarchaeota archaeon]
MTELDILHQLYAQLLKTETSHPLALKAIQWALKEGNLNHFKRVQGKEPWLREAINRIQNTLVAQQQNPFYPFPSAKHFQGNIPMFTLNNKGETFFIFAFDLTYHIVIVGSSGSGKSTAVMVMSKELFPYAKLTYWDRKRQYRALLKLYPNRVKVLRLKYYLRNPLQVESNDDAIAHLTLFAQVFCKENYLLESSKNLIIKAGIELYKERGVLDKSNNYPTLRDLLKRLIKLKPRGYGREADAYYSTINRLSSFIDLGCFDVIEGLMPEHLFSENIVREVDGISSEFHNTIICLDNAFLLRKRMLKKEEAIVLNIVDEARLLFDPLREKNFSFGRSSINDLIAMSRELNIGWCLVTQEPSSLTQTALSNAGMLILFPLTSYTEMLSFSKSLGLTQEQIKFTQSITQPGIGITKYFRYPNQFLSVITPIENLEEVINEEADESIQPLLSSVKIIYAKEEIIEVKQEIEPKLILLLNSIYLHKAYSTTQHFRIIDVSNSTGESLKNKAKERGLIEEFKLKLSKNQRSGMTNILALTSAGYSAIGQKPKLTMRGNTKHNFIAELITEYYQEKGFIIQTEFYIPQINKSLDILAVNHQERIGFEICLSKSNLNEITGKAGYVDKLILIFETEKDITRINGKNIEYSTVADFSDSDSQRNIYSKNKRTPSGTQSSEEMESIYRATEGSETKYARHNPGERSEPDNKEQERT